jgi:hypothetical protein
MTRRWHPQKRVELVILGRQAQGLLLALREGLLGPGQQQFQLLGRAEDVRRRRVADALRSISEAVARRVFSLCVPNLTTAGSNYFIISTAWRSSMHGGGSRSGSRGRTAALRVSPVR